VAIGKLKIILVLLAKMATYIISILTRYTTR